MYYHSFIYAKLLTGRTLVLVQRKLLNLLISYQPIVDNWCGKTSLFGIPVVLIISEFL